MHTDVHAGTDPSELHYVCVLISIDCAFFSHTIDAAMKSIV